MSSSGGRFSGFMPLSSSIFRTDLLLVICSSEILPSVLNAFSFVLKMVISVAKSLALIVMVGKKSANTDYVFNIVQ